LDFGRFDSCGQLGGSNLKRYLFTKDQRLKTNEQIRAVLAHKCCVGNDLFRLYVAPNECGYPRLGVSVGRSCGPSVARNRLKRLAREVFRCQQHNIAADFDYLLIFSLKMSKKSKSDNRPATTGLTFEQLNEAFLVSAARAAKKLAGLDSDRR
jgi:ribonuclease P protein component